MATNMIFGVNLIPNNDVNNSYALGNSQKRWKLYVDEINGELCVNGKIPLALLPDTSKSVIEANSLSDFPATGESEKIYIAKGTDKAYYWDGTAYVEISSTLTLGETSTTAYRGDRGKVAYDHATENKYNRAAALGLYEIAVTAEGHIANLMPANIRDYDTTYTLRQDSTDGHIIILTPSTGNPQTITIPDNDTTYDDATQTVHGLMSVTDKIKLDSLDGTAYVRKSGDTMTGDLTMSNKNITFTGTWKGLVFAGGTNTNSAGISYGDTRLTFDQTNKDGTAPERFILPTPSARSEQVWYNILTTKNLVTIAQGGTGANDAPNAQKNIIGTTPYITTLGISDLNNFFVAGLWQCAGNTANAPVTNPCFIWQSGHGTDRWTQIGWRSTDTVTKNIYMRKYYSGEWGEWTQINQNIITGVKGNAESSYRTGNVNLTPANLGALPQVNAQAVWTLGSNTDSANGPSVTLRRAGGDNNWGLSFIGKNASGTETFWTLINKDGSRNVALLSDFDSYVKKSGDTMTGDLIMNNYQYYLGHTTKDITETPSTDWYGNGLFLRDKNSVIYGFVRGMDWKSGYHGLMIGARSYVDGNSAEAQLHVLINDSGDRVIETSNQTLLSIRGPIAIRNNTFPQLLYQNTSNQNVGNVQVNIASTRFEFVQLGTNHTNYHVYQLPSTGNITANDRYDIITSRGGTMTGELTVPGITITNTGRFVYSGIQEASANSNRPIWFDNSQGSGTPCYSSKLTFNASTGLLKTTGEIRSGAGYLVQNDGNYPYYGMMASDGTNIARMEVYAPEKRLSFLEYINGYWEKYRLPLPDTSLASNKTYDIITSQGGTMTGTLTSTAQTGFILKGDGTKRIYAYLRSDGDYQADLTFGYSGTNKWGFSQRNSAEGGYLGLYNNTTGHWPTRWYPDDHILLGGRLDLSSAGMKTSSVSGWHTDQHGNFIHNQHVNETESWNIMNNAGESMFRYYWETGASEQQGPLYIHYSVDTSGVGDTGGLVVGDKAGENIAIDGNEIFARNNKTASTLFLQTDGGNIVVGNNTNVNVTIKGVPYIRNGNYPALLYQNSSGTKVGGVQYNVGTNNVSIVNYNAAGTYYHHFFFPSATGVTANTSYNVLTTRPDPNTLTYKSTNIDISAAPSSEINQKNVTFQDKNGNEIGYLVGTAKTNGEVAFTISGRRGSYYNGLGLGFDKNNKPTVYFGQPQPWRKGLFPTNLNANQTSPAEFLMAITSNWAAGGYVTLPLATDFGGTGGTDSGWQNATIQTANGFLSASEVKYRKIGRWVEVIVDGRLNGAWSVSDYGSKVLATLPTSCCPVDNFDTIGLVAVSSPITGLEHTFDCEITAGGQVRIQILLATNTTVSIPSGTGFNAHAMYFVTYT